LLGSRRHGDPDQFGKVSGFYFFHDPGAVGLDGASADPELAGYHLMRMAGDETFKDFPFAGR
jgi:hypothetical protein